MVYGGNVESQSSHSGGGGVKWSHNVHIQVVFIWVMCLRFQSLSWNNIISRR